MKKNIIISGAGRGIGRATALLAASRGIQVFAISRNIENLKGIENIHAFSVDLSDKSAIASFCNEVSIKNEKFFLFMTKRKATRSKVKSNDRLF